MKQYKFPSPFSLPVSPSFLPNPPDLSEDSPISVLKPTALSARARGDHSRVNFLRPASLQQPANPSNRCGRCVVASQPSQPFP
ncbi:hypothetical protein E2C01_014218 [Portunus trituberculatus]|uniref:Uncharacterized protein n=1 Tax=Portunus trituberculatus TaxID=210409 RepID=A0A5B7DIL3_PORTR|nr:hypothetical protein [Portunus trituberculatus]